MAEENKEREQLQETTDPDLLEMSDDALAEMIERDGTEEGVEEGSEEEPTPEVDPEPGKDKPEEVEEPKQEPEEPEEVIRLRKQVEDKERFIQDRNREVGELRQNLRMLIEATQQKQPEQTMDDPDMREKFMDNPVGFMEQQLARKQMLQDLRRRMERQAVMEAVPDAENLRDDIARLALEDGWAPESVESFKRDLSGSPQLIKGYAARIATEKENIALKAEVAELKQKLADLPGSLIQKIDKAARSEKTLTAKAETGRKAEPVITEHDLADISDDALDALLKKSMD